MDYDLRDVGCLCPCWTQACRNNGVREKQNQGNYFLILHCSADYDRDPVKTWHFCRIPSETQWLLVNTHELHYDYLLSKGSCLPGGFPNNGIAMEVMGTFQSHTQSAIKSVALGHSWRNTFFSDVIHLCCMCPFSTISLNTLLIDCLSFKLNVGLMYIHCFMGELLTPLRFILIHYRCYLAKMPNVEIFILSKLNL